MLVKYYRQQKKLTQKEVAHKLGLSVRYYRSIEQGKSFPRREVLHNLEDLFELPQRILLAKSAEEVPEYMKNYLEEV